MSSSFVLLTVVSSRLRLVPGSQWVLGNHRRMSPVNTVCESVRHNYDGETCCCNLILIIVSWCRLGKLDILLAQAFIFFSPQFIWAYLEVIQCEGGGSRNWCSVLSEDLVRVPQALISETCPGVTCMSGCSECDPVPWEMIRDAEPQASSLIRTHMVCVLTECLGHLYAPWCPDLPPLGSKCEFQESPVWIFPNTCFTQTHASFFST